ncbi:MAG: preprotein translocase subunit SecE [Bacteroidia bacterium]|nr:preprotein translocase subunit SecE [Bacteroidia bacterium]
MSKIKTYIEETRNELVNKVSWPTWKELQDSAVIVLIASLIIAAVIWVVDLGLKYVLEFIYGFFK